MVRALLEGVECCGFARNLGDVGVLDCESQPAYYLVAAHLGRTRIDHDNGCHDRPDNDCSNANQFVSYDDSSTGRRDCPG